VEDDAGGDAVSDPWNDPDYRRYAEHAYRELLPKVLGSAVAISLMPSPNNEQAGDVKYWTELGAMIMHDKPIIVVAAPGQQIPKRLRRVADAVVDIDITTQDGSDRMIEALTVVMDRLDREEADG
jgi:hypothetical protein